MIAKAFKSIHIRPMGFDDLSQVIQIENKSYDYPWSNKILYGCLENKYDCYVAAQNGEVLGYLISKISFPESHILNLTVENRQREKGIGSQLLDLALSKSKLLGSQAIFLETRKTNEAAKHLYNKYEFKKIGIRPNYYKTKDGKEDALVYCKKLDLIGT
ncbi:MAG: ribosomal protein S18-alanine N-acetyltransferase [Pseudomonadota bacterium]|nr:ribosomal protein S18-alanine N-acetyltransferase [Pseudomonadota bacterium]